MSSDYPFTVEYAKSGRAGCKGCKMNIEKDVLRFGIMVQSPHFDGRVPLWHHSACFWRKARVTDVSDIHNLDRLRWDDQESVRAKVAGTSTVGSNGTSASSAEPKNTDFTVEYSKTASSKCKSCGEKLKKAEIRIGKKGGGFYHFKCFSEKVDELGVKFQLDSIPGFVDGLTEEDQKECLKILKPLKRKPNVENGESSSTVPKKPKVDPDVAKEKKLLKEQSEALWKIKDNLEDLTKADGTTMLQANNQEVPVQSKIPECLADCFLFGPLAPCEECNGGQLVYSTTHNAYKCTGSMSGFTNCQFTTQDPKRLKLEIPDDLKEDYPYLASFKFKAGRKRVFPTNLTVRTKTPEEIISTALIKKRNGKSTPMSSARFISSAPSTTKMVIKGGAAVDPDSELTAVAHVYQDKSKNIYNAILNMTEVKEGRNSFYKLQLLEHDKNKKYWVFRAWGRIGTTIGGVKVDSFSNLQDAIANFKEVYLDKTGNHFEERHNFVKYPNRFMPVDIDYSDNKDDEVPLSKIAFGSKSTLPLPIQDFIKTIFDIEKMNDTMKEFELDLKKMPLGKLSQKQIKQAYSVLTDLQKVLQTAQPNQTQILDCSNRFYTLIPHDFGTQKPTMLDSLVHVKTKTEMLDNLLEIELAYSILKSEGDTGEKDPVDVHYEKLATDIEVLEKTSKEYKLIVDYAKKTHASTHTMYTLDIQDIFKISRHGEFEKFKKCQKLDNHMLLWHGSRTSNFAGILSQGLRIAPPEAPVTGYMFGKGIYFADMVSKSANYCCTSMSNNVGFLLLSDVALGQTHDLLKADSNLPKGLPKDKQSVKGCGSTTPDPKGFVNMENGVTIPMGRGVPSGINGCTLLYNEYIVYDIAQVNMKYLIKAKFNYKVGF